MAQAESTRSSGFFLKKKALSTVHENVDSPYAPMGRKRRYLPILPIGLSLKFVS
jgi:hypothetical protein